MSRLSGFVGYAEDTTEVLGITWKNYLTIDSFIYRYCIDNNLAVECSLDENNIVLRFKTKGFETIIEALRNKIKEGFNEDMIMEHSIEEAEHEWKHILTAIDDFFNSNYWYEGETYFEYFSCN